MKKRIKAFIEGGYPSKLTGKPYYSVYIKSGDGLLDYFILGDGYSVEEAAADFLAAYHEIKEEFTAQGRPFTEAFFEFVKDFDSPSPLTLPDYILQNKPQPDTSAGAAQTHGTAHPDDPHSYTCTPTPPAPSLSTWAHAGTRSLTP